MKTKIRIFAALLILSITFTAGMAKASLINIGTAYYATDPSASKNTPVANTEHEYNLFYDTEQDITWLDYRYSIGWWQNQVNWAAGLNDPGVLTYNLNANATAANWNENDQWRLPETGADPNFFYDQTNSEMGHLFYTELGNSAGTLSNTGDFANLSSPFLWYGTRYTGVNPNFAYTASWFFNMEIGRQATSWTDHNGYFSMAVRGEPIATPTPEPATMLLLGTGLTGLAFSRRRRKKKA